MPLVIVMMLWFVDLRSGTAQGRRGKGAGLDVKLAQEDVMDHGMVEGGCKRCRAPAQSGIGGKWAAGGAN